MKTLSIFGLLLLSSSLFAQETAFAIQLNPEYFSKYEKNYVTCSEGTLPKAIVKEVNELPKSAYSAYSYCLFDSIVLGNGKQTYLYSIAETNNNEVFCGAIYYLASEQAGEYKSYRLFQEGSPYFSTQTSYPKVSLDAQQFLYFVENGQTVATIDLFNSAPIDFSIISWGYEPVFPISWTPINSWAIFDYSSLLSSSSGPSFSIPCIFPSQPIVNIPVEPPFDFEAYFKDLRKDGFFTALLQEPYLASKAHLSSLNDSMYELSRSAFEIQIEAVEKTLKKELPKKA